MKKPAAVRVRFAPSPTGYLHVGGARTALFNYLFARHYKGEFLLRIEDSDVSRSNREMIEIILRSLKWLGLNWDGEPIYQSTRIERHREIAAELVRRGVAYPCFCTPEELKGKRELALRTTGEYKYDRKCYNLSRNEVEEKLKKDIPRVIRFHVPEGETTFIDGIRDRVTVQNQEIDDFIILRSDNTPVYQIAVVIDDHDMGITHVIRGDDHLSNTPKQILIYQAMGWTVPGFAHVPMILGPDKKRLSKRHGATSVEEYKKAGYLPQAVVNFLALLGWSPGDDREIMSMKEMVEEFTLERVSKNPAVLDETKLTWMNSQYLTRMDSRELLRTVVDLLKEAGLINESFVEQNESYLLQYIDLIKGRTKKLTDFVEWGRYFFKDPEVYEQKAVEKYWKKEGVVDLLRKLNEQLKSIKLWKAEEIEKIMRSLADENGIGAGKVIHPTRLALTGFGVSPGLFELMEVLGKERVIRRLGKAIDYLA